MEAERGADGDAVQKQAVQENGSYPEFEVKERMKAWVSSSMCWCDKDDSVYCTVCEIMIDATERIEYLENLIQNKVIKETT